MVDATFTQLCDAMLANTRQRHPAFKFMSTYDVYPHLKLHLENTWVAYKADDRPAFRDALCRLAAETQRAAEDLGLELGGRFPEMVSVQASKSRHLCGIVTTRDLYARLEITLDLLKLAMFTEASDRLTLKYQDDPIGACNVARPLDFYLSIYLTCWIGSEALCLTPRSTPAA